MKRQRAKGYDLRAAKITGIHPVPNGVLCAFLSSKTVKFNRAVVKLDELIAERGRNADEGLMKLAFEFLAELLDPERALAKAKEAIDVRRKA